jgi:drug/metabolite transporter (DMT)-like permease
LAGSFLFLGERLDPTQWIGVAIVLVAVYVIIRRTSAAGLERDELRAVQVAARR